MNAERVVRRLLWAFPATWRRQHGEEFLWMVNEERRGRSLLTLEVAGDIIGHGFEMRTARLLGFVPPVTRHHTAVLATNALAPLTLLGLLVFERSTPTAAIPVMLGWLLSAILMLGGAAGPARAVMVLTTAGGAMIPLVSTVLGWPRPPLFVLGPLVLLGTLACLETPRLDHRLRRRMRAGTALFTIVTATLLTWSWMGMNGFDGPLTYRTAPMPVLTTAIWVTVLLVLTMVVIGRLRAWVVPVVVTSLPLLLFVDAQLAWGSLWIFTALVGMLAGSRLARPAPAWVAGA